MHLVEILQQLIYPSTPVGRGALIGASALVVDSKARQPVVAPTSFNAGEMQR